MYQIAGMSQGEGRKQTRLALLLVVALAAAPGWAATCGDGVLDQNEECDPGGALYQFGDPALPACDGGGGGVSGSECFFQHTCCKFNCQFANPGPCSDGNDCTITDQCNNVGQCQLGTPVIAGTPCGDSASTECDLADTCDGAGACDDNVQPVNTPCGSPATGECDPDDTCNGAGSCEFHTAPAGTAAPTQCPDGNACTADQCNGAGGCQNPPRANGTPCGSATNDACTDPDTCNGAGVCLANHATAGTSAAGFCDDANACTADQCNGAGGCQNPASPPGTACGSGADTACTDPDTCNGAGACLANHAAAGPAPGGGCPDANPCTADACDGGGSCANPPLANGTPCGDSADTDCTNPDTCNGAGSCTANHASNGAPCGDSADTACTDPDTCNGAGTCRSNHAGAGVACGDSADTTCTDPDTCDGAGACAPHDVADGVACDDGAFCTLTDTCGGGICVGVDDPCADGAVCQRTCNEAAQNCLALAGASCDDGDACNGLATCDGVGACVPGTGLADGSPCDDGDFCTIVDLCRSGTCEPGPNFLAAESAKLSSLTTLDGTCVVNEPGGVLRLGAYAFMEDGSRLVADTLRMGSRASAFDVEANSIGGRGTVRGTTAPANLPAVPYCTMPPVTCAAGNDVVVVQGEVRSLPPGAYGKLTLLQDATVLLETGDYDFCEVLALSPTVIEAVGPGTASVIRVAGRLRMGRNARISATAGARRPVLFIGSEARFNASADLHAHFVVPDGKFKIGRGSLLDGSVCAQSEQIGRSSTLVCDPLVVLPPLVTDN